MKLDVSSCCQIDWLKKLNVIYLENALGYFQNTGTAKDDLGLSCVCWRQDESKIMRTKAIITFLHHKKGMSKDSGCINAGFHLLLVRPENGLET